MSSFNNSWFDVSWPNTEAMTGMRSLSPYALGWVSFNDISHAKWHDETTTAQLKVCSAGSAPNDYSAAGEFRARSLNAQLPLMVLPETQDSGFVDDFVMLCYLYIKWFTMNKFYVPCFWITCAHVGSFSCICCKVWKVFVLTPSLASSPKNKHVECSRKTRKEPRWSATKKNSWWLWKISHWGGKVCPSKRSWQRDWWTPQTSSVVRLLRTMTQAICALVLWFFTWSKPSRQSHVWNCKRGAVILTLTGFSTCLKQLKPRWWFSPLKANSKLQKSRR